MKMKMLKEKKIWHWLGIPVAVCAAFVAIYGSGRAGLAWGLWDSKITVFLLLGVAAEIVTLFIPKDFLYLLPVFFYCAALVFVINGGILVILDYVRQITWVGGNYSDCLLYLAGTVIACVLTTVRCFCPTRKVPVEIVSEIQEGKNGENVK